MRVVAQRPLLALLSKDAVVRAQLLLLAQPQLLSKDVVVRAQLLLLVQPQLLAQAPREAAVAKEAVHQPTRSF